MVSLNIPAQNKKTDPALIRPQIDRSVLQSAAQSVQATGDILNAQLNDLNQKTTESRRAAIIAEESKRQLDLALPESLSKLENINIAAIEQISAIDEAKRRAEQAKTDKAYGLNTLIQFQTEFNNFTRQAEANIAADGFGHAEAVQNFINDRMKQYVDSAPSEDARLMAYEKLSMFKVEAMDKAFQQEDLQRRKYRINQATSVVDMLSNEILSSPDFSQVAENKLGDIADVLSENGVADADVMAFLKSAKATFIDSQVKGVLNSQDPTKAMFLLSAEDVKASLPTEQYQRLVNDTGSTVRQFIKEQEKTAKEAMTLQAFVAGKLPAGFEGFDKAADMAANQLLFSQLGDTSNVESDGIPNIASSVATYFKKYPSGMGADTKKLLINKVMSSTNPYEVVAYSLGLNNLAQDPSGGAGELFNTLPEAVRAKVGRVANLASFGVDAKNAINIVNKELEASNNPAIKVALSQQVADSKKDVESLVKSTLDTSWFSSADKYSVSKVNNDALMLYESNLVRYGNPELAKEATRQGITTKYGMTDINGAGNTYMEAAPELYYQGDLLKEFKSSMEQTKINVSSSLGIPAENLEIRPIPSVTISQPAANKTYMLVDKSTGLRLTKRDEQGRLSYVDFDFKVDTTKYGQELATSRKALEFRRDMVNNARKNNEKYLDAWLEASDTSRVL